MSGRLGIALLGCVVGVYGLMHPEIMKTGGGDHAGVWPWLLGLAGLVWVGLGYLPKREPKRRGVPTDAQR